MKTKLLTLVTLAFLGMSNANAQVGIGTTSPDASAVLDVESTTKGFLPPRMNTTERDAISSPALGLTIYNEEVNCLQWFNGTAWYDRCEGGLTPGPLSDCPTIPPFLPADETIVKDVTNPVTGDTWMDRNLGAYTADRTPPSAAGGTDCWAYGNMYQWGRGNDGHEDRNSSPTTGPVADTYTGSDFITVGAFPYDWLDSQDDDRWNANETAGGAIVKTVNDPCPDGYRVPTLAELQNELASWGSNQNGEGAINSPLKLSLIGFRSNTGGIFATGSGSHYWSSTTVGTSAHRLRFNSTQADTNSSSRVDGFAVRCIKE